MTKDTVCPLCKGTGIMPKVHDIEEFYKEVEDCSCDQGVSCLEKGLVHRLDKKIQIKDEFIKKLQDRLEREGIYGL